MRRTAPARKLTAPRTPAGGSRRGTPARSKVIKRPRVAPAEAPQVVLHVDDAPPSADGALEPDIAVALLYLKCAEARPDSRFSLSIATLRACKKYEYRPDLLRRHLGEIFSPAEGDEVASALVAFVLENAAGIAGAEAFHLEHLDALSTTWAY